ncbi:MULTISPECIES: ABC transporter permease [Azospirillum]|uniref:Peptide/nickel transport system permease protein n=1 Tax=Azospirillum rugosum TaxID=416170 RepID=A0ABS4SXR7_9PROT|nr:MULTISPECIES: ABC transporter permease [Azospirillum]MBP2296170.1 peptide/nickel transport system permease protein [Azospirillum rugosum]MCW2240081.1 peptide/nickel transport system permease protein [Azospirillum canadense]MDQ0527145.1 peptide/nickel transport system permease protein [Azospirillum rugosum]
MTDLLRRLVRTPQGAIGLLLLLVLAAVCLFGPWLAPQDPEKIDFLGRFRPAGAENWFGADQLGRDVLSRLLVGARSTIPMALAATLLGTVIGSVVGTASAYLGGRWDEAIMRTIDAVMAVPGLLLALLLVSTLGNGATNAMVAIAVAFAPGMARVTRSVALNVRNQDYVKAAIVRGERGSWIVFREMLPNVMAPVVIETTIRVSFAVMLFATLSFLGLGAQPPASEWGLMVADARQYVHQAPWILIAPSIAIAVTAIAFNLLGDGLRDAMNPRNER